MKTTLSTLAAALLFTAATAVTSTGGKDPLTVNSEKSTIFWTGKKVTGEHTGTLMLNGGTITVENGAPIAADITIDMSTIAVTDITDKGTNAKLVGHLNSPDFFDVNSHPEGRFVATSFEPIAGASGDTPNYTVTGDLTLKGVTNPVSFPAFIAIKNGKLVANGKVTFDRTKYDIRYGSGSFFEGLGDKAIYDDVDLHFVLAAGE